MTTEQIAAKSAELWAGFNDSEKFGVKFGMFPAEPMQTMAAGLSRDDSRDITVALMDLAKAWTPPAKPAKRRR